MTKSKTVRTLTADLKEGASKLPLIAGITIPEILVLGAAGYVLWRNRAKIQDFLEEHGIDSPSILSGDFSDLIQSGVSMLDRNHSQSKSVRRHDA